MAQLYPHKRHGNQLCYIIYFPDGKDKKKYRFVRKKSKAKELLKLARELEYI